MKQILVKNLKPLNMMLKLLVLILDLRNILKFKNPDLSL